MRFFRVEFTDGSNKVYKAETILEARVKAHNKKKKIKTITPITKEQKE
jgi:hypothetical protein